MKAPTMQEIADSLDISRVTVWKVFHNQPGVSDVLRQRVIQKAVEMGYSVQKFQIPEMTAAISPAAVSPAATTLTISVVVSRPESSPFWMNIIHNIAKELGKREINLMYTYVPSFLPAGYTMPPVLTNGTVQGIIVLNVYDFTLFSMINKLPLPKIFLDYPPALPDYELAGDLVLLDGKHAIQTITQHIIQSGRKNVGFIGDLKYAYTNTQRYEGYIEAMDASNTPVKPEYMLTGPIGIESYQKEIYRFLDGFSELPDALVCVSDYIAGFVIQYLETHDYQIPEDIAISGFDGILNPLDCKMTVTTVPVDTTAVGKRLAEQILFRLNHLNMPYETIQVRLKPVFGETTR